MNIDETAIILIGFQKDYFASNGILNNVIKNSDNNVLTNTINLIEALSSTAITLIATPIFFTENYSELVNPIGILKLVRDVGAFKKNSSGAESIDEFAAFGERILVVEGKRGLNAFHDTELEPVLKRYGIKNVVLAGVVTSICIDSTARSALESGFNVTVLSDCTAGRTEFEQNFYCTEIFPLYAQVITSADLLKTLTTD